MAALVQRRHPRGSGKAGRSDTRTSTQTLPAPPQRRPQVKSLERGTRFNGSESPALPGRVPTAVRSYSYFFTSDLTPLSFSSSSRGCTTRKPTKVASVCHQMLCGRCGSSWLQSGFEAWRAAQRTCLGSSSQEPPRTTFGYFLAVGSSTGSTSSCPGLEPL